MGAVDKSDVVVTGISTERKTIKRYEKFFFRTLDVSVWNSCRLCKLEAKKDTWIADFHPTLTRQIVEKYRKDNFVEIITESLDKNPVEYFPSICTGSMYNRKSAARKGQTNRESHYRCKIRDVSLRVRSMIFRTKLYR